MAHQGHSVLIAAERLDVLWNPVQGLHNVLQSLISRDGIRRKEAWIKKEIEKKNSIVEKTQENTENKQNFWIIKI